MPDEQSEQEAEPLTSLYLPATQAVHVPPFAPVYPPLQAHAALAELELGALALAGQATQVEDALAPAVPEYVASPQSVHASLPVVALYLPATHTEHTPPFGPEYPTLQAHDVLDAAELELAGQATQLESAVAAIVTEYVPAEQSEQAAEPLTALYLPATHPEHVPPFAPVYPVLQEQAPTAELELGALEFEGQPKHVDDVLAPAVTEYVPEEQSEQAAEPLTALYLPATQAVHGPPFAPVYPTLQAHAATSELELGAFALAGQATQVEDALAPTVTEYVVIPQPVHAALPLLVLYLPATHPEHTPPSGPVNPALHTQAAIAELDTPELEFATHDTHVAEAVAPTASEYVPTPQSMHTALPPLVLYFPATHAEQTPPSGPV